MYIENSMFKIIISLCFFVLLAPSSSFAKEKNDTSYQYFDYSWEKTKKKKAQYYAKIWKEGDIWHRQDYYMMNDQLQMDGHYADADFKVKHGGVAFYFENGRKQQVATYDHDKIVGEYTLWFANGKKKQWFHYQNGTLVDTNVLWHANGQPSLVALLDHNGTGTGEEFYEDGTKIGTGKYVNGKRQGVWTFSDQNKIVSQIVKYDQDSAMQIQNYDEGGKETKGENYVEKTAEFPGGLEGYRKYLEKSLRYPEVSQIRKVQGVATLEMVIDNTGKVKSVKLLGAPDVATGREAVKVLQYSPDWTPAVQHNRKVACSFEQRVTFALR